MGIPKYRTGHGLTKERLILQVILQVIESQKDCV